jgi:general secretion pathway protein M
MKKIFARTLALSLLAVALLSVAELAKLPLLKYRDNQQTIEDLRERLGRFAAITAARTADGRLLERRERRWAQETLTFDEPNSGRAAAALQENVKSVIDGAGGKLMSTRILPVEEQGAFYRVAAQVRLQATTDNIGPTLLGLESSFPYLFLEQVSVSSLRGRLAQQRGEASVPLNVTLEVSGYLRADRVENEAGG